MTEFGLNIQQQQAAEFEDRKHVLVMAGAGTGKTRTIIARIIHLIKIGVKPWRILLLTFTRRAAGEMIERMHQVLGEQSQKVHAGTFHHFSLYTMRRMPAEFGLESTSVIDRDDQIHLINMIRDKYKDKNLKLPKAAEMVNLYSYSRNTVQLFKDYLEKRTEYKQPMIEILRNITVEYEQRKKINRYLDYDDILYLFAEKIMQNQTVRERLQTAYDYILVDEMQDTNPLQWQILDQLKNPPLLFCVGDDAQSIYSFRGADFRNVHTFTSRINDSKILKLEKNYRSTQGILDLANWLLDNSSLNYGKNLSAFRQTNSKPKLLNFYSPYDEAQWVTRDLLKKRAKNQPWNDHMILVRTTYSARILESYMIEANIPYRFIGGASLLQSAHIKDFISLIRSAVNHQDELAWKRYLKLWPRIGEATANKMIAHIRPAETTEKALKLLRKSYPKRTDIIDPVESLQSVLDQPQKALQQAADSLTPKLKTIYDNWDRRIRDFQLLIRMAENHDSITEFIEAYTLEPISVTSAERINDNDVVTLITVHSAKGTESKVCYAVQVQPGVYPHIRSIGSPEDEEEERRILYVAITRARDELIITNTLNKWDDFYDKYFFYDVNKCLIDTKHKF